MLDEHYLPIFSQCELLSLVQLKIYSDFMDITRFSSSYLVFKTQFTFNVDIIVGNELNVPAMGDFIVSISHSVKAVRSQMINYIEHQIRQVDKHRKYTNFEIEHQVF